MPRFSAFRKLQSAPAPTGDDRPVLLDGRFAPSQNARDPVMNNSGSPKTITGLDKMLAHVCVLCPVCRRARKRQCGVAFKMVQTVEVHLCPFCAAYERVHGRKAHEPLPR
jgi:hypothetical protein